MNDTLPPLILKGIFEEEENTFRTFPIMQMQAEPDIWQPSLPATAAKS